MKTIYLLLATIVLLQMISCKKEKDKVKVEFKAVIKPDNILFSNLSNAITKSSARDFVPQDHYSCFGVDPIPEDSSTSIPLDINNDNIIDFIVRLSHTPWSGWYCGHCPIYLYNITIYGETNSDSLACLSETIVAKYFGYNDKVSFENTWRNQALLILSGGCSGPSYSIGNKYIGFKHNKQIGWIKLESAENNGLTIENYAINLTDSNSIQAGQTK